MRVEPVAGSGGGEIGEEGGETVKAIVGPRDRGVDDVVGDAGEAVEGVYGSTIGSRQQSRREMIGAPILGAE